MPDRTTQVFSSQDTDPLEAQTDAVPSDVSGRRLFYFGLFKRPTDTLQAATSRKRVPGGGIDEDVIYSDIFQEDSSGGCISLFL